MGAAPLHKFETERMAKLRSLEVLDSQSEAIFDELTTLASEICEAPVSLISLVDTQRQWFKSRLGLSVSETPRDVAFCAHAILQEGIFEVPDALKDDRFSTNPLVLEEPNIRFYAGAPLVTEEGLPLGTLCVIDRKPRVLNTSQKKVLQLLAKQVVNQLEYRKATKSSLSTLQQFEKNGILLESFFQSSPFLMGVVARRGNRLMSAFLNEKARIFFHSSEKKQQDKDTFEFVFSPAEKEVWFSNLQKSESSDKPEGFECTRVNQDQKVRKLKINLRFLGTFTGQKDPHYLFIAEDITEKEVLQEEMNRLRDNFQKLFSAMPLALGLFSPQGQLHWVNEEWIRLLGEAKLNSLSIQDFVEKILSDSGEQQVFRAWLQAPSPRWLDLDIQGRGQGLPMSWSVTHLAGGFWALLGKNISEQRKQESMIRNQQMALLVQEKMSSLGEMAAGIAHEINNPLAIITGKASLMVDRIRKGKSNLDEIQESFEKIEVTAARIARIVRGLRSFSRSGDKTPFEPVEIKKLIEEVVGLFRQRAYDLGIKLTVECPGGLLIMGRETELNQVLLNLLSNSMDAVKNLFDKWIKIEVTESEDFLVLQIIDSGKGISEEIGRRMMDPFFTTKTVGEGTGLGLSITKGIVESHLGSFSYVSEAPQTTFEIRLPRLSDPT